MEQRARERCDTRSNPLASGSGLHRAVLLISLVLLTLSANGCAWFAKQPVSGGMYRSTGGAEVGGRIVQTAKRYLGVPYRPGGETPRQGFDCSGLTQKVYNEHDITLPRKSEEQARVGAPVARHDLRPGDLLFFDTSGRGAISHVGIYIGRDQMIHASQREGVCVDSISKDYFQRRFIAARRVAGSTVAAKARPNR